MLRIFLVLAAIVLGALLLRRFKKKHTQWQADRHFLDKVLIGLNQALQEVAVIQDIKGEYDDELEGIRSKITQYKNDIEYRRTVAPIKFDGFAAMAEDVDSMGTRLSQIGNRLGRFGGEGAWGCAFASTAFETMAEYDAKR